MSILLRPQGRATDERKMNSPMEKVKSIVSESKSFAIFFRQSAEEHELLAVMALKELLRKKEKVFLMPDISPDLIQKWSSVFTPSAEPKISFITKIKIPAEESGAKELSYEREGDSLSLKITSEKSPISKDQIEVESQPAPVDMIFSFFLNEAELLPFRDKIGFPEKEKIAHLAKNGITSAEKIYSLFSPEEFSGNKNASTLLLASLITETDNFSAPCGENALRMETELLNSGADKKIVLDLSGGEKSSGFAQILGRALARTRINKELMSSWSFISKEDFEKTGVDTSGKINLLLIHQIARKLKNNIEPLPLMIIAFQDGEGIWVFIKSFESDQKILKAASLMAGKPAEAGFLVVGPYKNFSEAEIEAQKLLKESSE